MQLSYLIVLREYWSYFEREWSQAREDIASENEVYILQGAA